MNRRAGHTGTMIAWGCAVWGTGWYYAPYVAYGAAVPVYYPAARGSRGGRRR
jgi:hypothetical protein